MNMNAPNFGVDSAVTRQTTTTPASLIVGAQTSDGEHVQPHGVPSGTELTQLGITHVIDS